MIAILFKTFREDLQTVFAKDPAARSVLEVIFCYPGLHARWLHRLAIPTTVEVVTKSEAFSWSALVEPYVYTLSAHSVAIGTGAIALGAITIGDSARIGSGSVVVKPVPPRATVVGISGRIVEDRYEPLTDLEHGKLPDPVAEAVRLILEEQEELGGRLKRLESLSRLIIPEDELTERMRELVREFNQGGGI